MKVRSAASAEALLGLAALATFVVYFGIHCFRYPWVGDLLRHCASVASLDRSFSHPTHEAMPVPGTQSDVHTPYIVAVAAVGKLVGVTPYRSLQIAGVANLVFYAWAVWFFFRTFSLLRGSWVPPAAFLLVSLFLRNRLFWWASETSFASVRLIQAYPSFFAWGTALTCFALAERFLRRPRVAPLAGIAVFVWATTLSHNLTASWIVGIVGLRAGIALAAPAGQRRGALVLLGTLAAAIALALPWPYFDIRVSPGLLKIPEGSEFGNHPFRDMAGLYALALPAALFFAARGRHLFWLAGFAATFLALQAFRVLGFEYGNRYAFFQAFFAQAFVAEAAAFAVALLLPATERLPENLRIGPALRKALLLFGGATALLTAAAPAVREESRAGRPLLTLRELAALPPTHDVYYARLGEVGQKLGPADIVMMPVEHAAWDVSSITGARVVASLFAYRVPDYNARVRDVARFFAPEADRSERRVILRRWGVTKVLLTPRVSDRERGMASELGPPIARTETLILFDAAGAELRPVSERLRHRDRLADRPAVVEVGHRRRISVAHQPSLVDPDGAAAVVQHLLPNVRDEEHGLSRLPELLDPRVAFPLELLVADREGLVHEEDVRLDVGRDRKRETGRHPGRVGAHRRIDELFDLRPLDDPPHAPLHLAAGEAQQRPLQHDVLAPGQLTVEAEAELEQRRDPADDEDPPCARRHHSGDQLQERALARAVPPDHPDGLAGLHLEGEVAQRLEFVEEEPPLESPDRVLLERADAFSGDAVSHRHLLEPDRGRHL